MGEGENPIARFPERSVLRAYMEDIKRRIGNGGGPQTRLAVTLGPISFDHSDAEVGRFIEMAFDLALETDMAVGFHIDDSMFWTNRKDLWSDPKNIEAHIMAGSIARELPVVLGGDRKEAEEHFKTAQRLDPRLCGRECARDLPDR